MSPQAALWGSIILGGVAQIALKRSVGRRAADGGPSAARWWARLALSPWLWAYALCFAAATVLWMVSLTRLDISYAFPLLSAGYVWVAALARVCLKETVPVRRWLAIAVICVGVALIARS